MNIYLDLFLTFLKIGLVSFGGGYAMIPLIQSEVESHGWLNTNQFNDLISLSAMAPGPIAANSATMVGYKVSDIPGAVIACTAVILPSLLLIIVISRLFARFQTHPVVISALYGLRSVIVGIIIFAAYKFAAGSGIIGGAGVIDIKSIVIMAVAFLLMLKTRTHPILIIIVSGAAGILLFR